MYQIHNITSCSNTLHKKLLIHKMHSQIQPLRNAMLTVTNNKKYKFNRSI